jgi:hypothetical protein
MRELDFGEIHSRDNVFISENKSRSRAVWTAKKLKAYENQTKQSHGRSPFVSRIRKRMLSGVRERIKIYDFPHSLCSGDSRSCLLDLGMVSLACISGLQPVYHNPQSQTANLKF